MTQFSSDHADEAGLRCRGVDDVWADPSHEPDCLKESSQIGAWRRMTDEIEMMNIYSLVKRTVLLAFGTMNTN
jgi:hypothetical protein